MAPVQGPGADIPLRARFICSTPPPPLRNLIQHSYPIYATPTSATSTSTMSH